MSFSATRSLSKRRCSRPLPALPSPSLRAPHSYAGQSHSMRHGYALSILCAAGTQDSLLMWGDPLCQRSIDHSVDVGGSLCQPSIDRWLRDP